MGDDGVDGGYGYWFDCIEWIVFCGLGEILIDFEFFGCYLCGGWELFLELVIEIVVCIVFVVWIDCVCVMCC